MLARPPVPDDTRTRTRKHTSPTSFQVSQQHATCFVRLCGILCIPIVCDGRARAEGNARSKLKIDKASALVERLFYMCDTFMGVILFCVCGILLCV